MVQCMYQNGTIVHICSNYSTHLPVRRCKRRVKGAARSRCNSASFLTQYNKGMAGVDLMERLLASYRPTIRGKKWYWPLFTNMLNIAVVPPLRHKQHKVTPPIIFETHYYDPLAKWNSEGIQGTERSIQRIQHMDRVTMSQTISQALLHKADARCV